MNLMPAEDRLSRAAPRGLRLPCRMIQFASLIACLTAVAGAWGQGAETGQVLRVGTKEAPPFAMRGDDGSWQGIAIELWQGIAERLDLQYELVETDLPGLLDGLENGSLDASAAALTIIPKRERRIDFTHPFHTSGLGIAVADRGGGTWLRFMRGFPVAGFLKLIAGLACALVVAGMVVWFFERRRNPEHFGGGWRGVGAAFWWSAVTMTTVGYGDKSPRTFGGRIMAIFWMFVSIIMISAFTATIASLMTAGRLTSLVQNADDLVHVRAATVANSTSEDYLTGQRVAFVSFPNSADALVALAAGEADAVVYDAPILRYLVNRMPGRSIHVLPDRLELQHYGIGLPANSPLREPANLAILEITGSPEWQVLLRRHLGG